jgi:hypothetical protein
MRLFGFVRTNMQAYMSVESVTNENKTRESFLNGRLSTVDLLVKLTYFEKKCLMFSISKGPDLS